MCKSKWDKNLCCQSGQIFVLENQCPLGGREQMKNKSTAAKIKKIDKNWLIKKIKKIIDKFW